MRHRKRWKEIVIVIVVLFLIALCVAGNVLVNVALVPATMEKTEAFSEITEESVEALVQTDDIQKNHETAVQETTKWLEKVSSERLTQETTDGYQLIGTYFSQDEDGKEKEGQDEVRQDKKEHKWVLLLHGYTGWKEEMYPFACQYWKQGYQVVVPDMRCQGESEGDFIGMGYTDSQDNLLWLKWIRQKDPDAEIVIHGQSMGAACGLMMAGDERLPDNVKAVVSDCAYTDAYTMFQRDLKDWFHLPSFPILNVAKEMLQLRGGYNLKDASALKGVENAKIPVLIIHGTEDEMIPVDMAYELYNHAPGEKKILIVEGAGHAQAPDKDPKKYYDTIWEFLENSL